MAESDLTDSLQSLQNIIDLVAVETGKSLRPRNRDGVKSWMCANFKQPITLPKLTENFHLALDELESQIILSKAHFSRDLDNIRSNKFPPKNSTFKDKRHATNLNASNEGANSENVILKEHEPKVEVEVLKMKTETPPRNQDLKSSPNLETSEQNDIKIKQETLRNKSIPAQCSFEIQVAPEIQAPAMTTSPEHVPSLKTGTSVSQNPFIDSLFDLPTVAKSNPNSTTNLGNITNNLEELNRPTQDLSQAQNANLNPFDQENILKESSIIDLDNLDIFTPSTNVRQSLNFSGNQNTSSENNLSQITFDGLNGIDDSVFDGAFFGDPTH